MKPSLILFIFITSQSLVSCTGAFSSPGQNNSSLNSWVKPQVNLLTLNEIAVFPFTASSNYPKQAMSEQDLIAINNKLLNQLKLKTSTIVPDCDNSLLHNSLLHNSLARNSTGTLIERAVEYGSACHAQAVLYGMVTKYGKDKSAAFTLWLYSFRHKAVVWSASYENSQPVLTDNLLSIGQKTFSFRSSEENLFSGFSQVATELELKRTGKN